jgi:hypothetical protein
VGLAKCTSPRAGFLGSGSAGGREMRSVAAAGIVVPAPRVLSRVKGAACEFWGARMKGALVEGVFDTFAAFEPGVA